MPTKRSKTPDPRCVEIGRRNQLKWKGFTPAGIQKLREAARKTRPWELSTGPRSVEGRRQSVLNGKRSQKGNLSVRELQAELSLLNGFMAQMEGCRRSAARSQPVSEQNQGG
jgi:hypothetical protein